MTDKPPSAKLSPTPGIRLLGGMLIAIGALIGGLGGMCTIYFEVMEISQLFNGTSAFVGISLLVLPIVFGCVPVAIGIVLFVTGRSLLRGK